MNRDQIERAERTARRLEKNFELARELRNWERPKSLATSKVINLKPDDHYTFTDVQMAIAMNVLDKKMGEQI